MPFNCRFDTQRCLAYQSTAASPPVMLNVTANARVNDNDPPAAEPAAEPAAKPMTEGGTTMVDMSDYPNENAEGKTHVPDVQNQNVIDMMVHGRSDEIKRMESSGKIEVMEDEQSCMYRKYSGTSVSYKDCATFANRSIPNPAVKRLFAVKPPPRLLSNKR